jgi:hypothetical protein
MATELTPQSPGLQQVDLGDAYQQVYDLLGRMYWEASDLSAKDLIFGAREAVGEIVDDINQQQLKLNDQAFKALGPRFSATNAALRKIQDDVSNITKNISTAASTIAAISKVLSFFPA